MKKAKLFSGIVLALLGLIFVIALQTDFFAGLPNFGKVEDGFYRGAQTRPWGYDELKKAGIKTVVNLRKDWTAHFDKKFTEKEGIKFISLPWIAKKGCPPGYLDEFFSIVNDPENRPVFVHCKHGKDRTGFMIAAYRVKYDGWSEPQAFQEMESYGHKEKQFPVLRRQLLEFKENTDNKRRATSD